MEAQILFYLLFGIFGLLLNVIVIAAITFDKSMSSPTYRFMSQLALADVEAIIGMFLGPPCQYLAGASRTRNNNGWVKLFVYFNCCGFRTSIVWMMLVAISRWVVFAKHTAVDQWLSKKRSQYVIRFLVWGSVHLFYSPLFYIGGSFVPVGDDLGAYTYTNETVSLVYRYFDEPLVHGGAIVQILFNVLSVAIIYKMRKQILAPELRANHKREIRLWVQCGLDSLVYCSYDFFYVIYLHTDSSTEYFAFPGMWYSLLLNHVDCALLYLCFNTRLRNLIVDQFRKVFAYNSGASVAPQPALQPPYWPSASHH